MNSKAHESLPFHREMDFEYGVLEPVGEGVRRLVCRNPGALTYKGTNLYVVGEGEVAVIDPGPAEHGQVDELLSALGSEKVTDIVITHAHSDHSGAAAELKARTGARLLGLPRRADDPGVGNKGPSGGSFVTPVTYDEVLADGDVVAGDGFTLNAVHTPGHAPDHLCLQFAERNVLFSGDHVMGWNTSVVAPPEGHMGSYLASLETLMTRGEALYYPAHGGPIVEPQRLVKAFIMHRRWRESEIAECLRQGLETIDQVVPKIYGTIDPRLNGAAALSVLAQIELLIEKGLVSSEPNGPLDRSQRFVWVGPA